MMWIVALIALFRTSTASLYHKHSFYGSGCSAVGSCYASAACSCMETHFPNGDKYGLMAEPSASGTLVETWYNDTSCGTCKVCKQEFVNATCYQRSGWADKKMIWSQASACSNQVNTAAEWCEGSSENDLCPGADAAWQAAAHDGLPSGCSDDGGDQASTVWGVAGFDVGACSDGGAPTWNADQPSCPSCSEFKGQSGETLASSIYVFSTAGSATEIQFQDGACGTCKTCEQQWNNNSCYSSMSQDRKYTWKAGMACENAAAVAAEWCPGYSGSSGCLVSGFQEVSARAPTPAPTPASTPAPTPAPTPETLVASDAHHNSIGFGIPVMLAMFGVQFPYALSFGMTLHMRT